VVTYDICVRREGEGYAADIWEISQTVTGIEKYVAHEVPERKYESDALAAARAWVDQNGRPDATVCVHWAQEE